MKERNTKGTRSTKVSFQALHLAPFVPLVFRSHFPAATAEYSSGGEPDPLSIHSARYRSAHPLYSHDVGRALQQDRLWSMVQVFHRCVTGSRGRVDLDSTNISLRHSPCCMHACGRHGRLDIPAWLAAQRRDTGRADRRTRCHRRRRVDRPAPFICIPLIVPLTLRALWLLLIFREENSCRWLLVPPHFLSCRPLLHRRI